MTQLKYTNIFEAIVDDTQEAADLQFRSDLMLVLRDIFEMKKWGQAEIGQALEIPQPRVSELVNGKVHKFSSDKLIGFLAMLGFRFKPTFVAGTMGKELPVKCSVYAQAA